MLVLDISCRHLGDEFNSMGFCVPFGHRGGRMYIFGICISWIYMLVLDISCHHLGYEKLTTRWRCTKIQIIHCKRWNIVFPKLTKQIPGQETLSQSSRAQVIITINSHIFRHLCLVEGPVWSRNIWLIYIGFHALPQFSSTFFNFFTRGGGGGTQIWHSTSDPSSVTPHIFLEIYNI